MSSKHTCPICKAKNRCHADNPTISCWCTTYKFPDNLQERFQHLPENVNEKLNPLPEQCICSTCAQKLGAIKINNTNKCPKLEDRK